MGGMGQGQKLVGESGGDTAILVWRHRQSRGGKKLMPFSGTLSSPAQALAQKEDMEERITTLEKRYLAAQRLGHQLLPTRWHWYPRDGHTPLSPMPALGQCQPQPQLQGHKATQ